MALPGTREVEMREKRKEDTQEVKVGEKSDRGGQRQEERKGYLRIQREVELRMNKDRFVCV